MGTIKLFNLRSVPVMDCWFGVVRYERRVLGDAAGFQNTPEIHLMCKLCDDFTVLVDGLWDKGRTYRLVRM